MSRPGTFTLTPVAADADGVCQSQTPVGAGNLTINGALATAGVATFSQPARVSITTTIDDSARTFTITGTDRFGNALVEAVTGPTTTTNSTSNFATITQIAVDAATAGAITVGNADVLESAWYPWERYSDSYTAQVTLSAGASMTYELQHTATDLQTAGFAESSATAVADATATAQSANGIYKIAVAPLTGSRLNITSFVSGTAEVRWIHDR